MEVKNLKVSIENIFLKQKDISKLFNNDPPTISGWKQKKSNSIRKLIFYANHYKISLDD